jgi:hypothetical protein
MTIFTRVAKVTRSVSLSLRNARTSPRRWRCMSSVYSIECCGNEEAREKCGLLFRVQNHPRGEYTITMRNVRLLNSQSPKIPVSRLSRLILPTIDKKWRPPSGQLLVMQLRSSHRCLDHRVQAYPLPSGETTYSCKTPYGLYPLAFLGTRVRSQFPQVMRLIA